MEDREQEGRKSDGRNDGSKKKLTEHGEGEDMKEEMDNKRKS